MQEQYITNKYRLWSTDEYFDIDTRNELASIREDTGEIYDRFYKDPEFGTGGLRAVMGAGSNRMNIYTIRKATFGLAEFLLKSSKTDIKVVIAYDSRNNSERFAKEAALCLCTAGIKAYVFCEPVPTPMLSFAVRHLKCTAGIVITASHNTKEYNGYKVYYKDGAQITSPYDLSIISEINAITEYTKLQPISMEEAVNASLYLTVKDEVYAAYMAELKRLSLNETNAKALRIVYTPLHGTGGKFVSMALEQAGFEDLHLVPEQAKPDGDFPTLVSPNPEDQAAFSSALELARQTDADIVLATDPDADRLGIYVKASDRYVSLSGNMTGILMMEYILESKKKANKLNPKSAAVTTIVSTRMADAVADSYNIELIRTLTGFKYIGEQIKIFEQSNTFDFVFGFEESCGTLAGSYVRDKDAVAAAMLICEIASFYKQRNMTLIDKINELFQKYGYYKEELVSITLKGAAGAEKINQLMSKLRSAPPASLGSLKVEGIVDYSKDTELPKSNVLYFNLEQKSWVAARPSGTEPKIKFYIGVKSNSIENADRIIGDIVAQLKETAK